MTTRLHQRGFTIIELMVALFILSVGLLGLAALQAQAYRAESESYDRSRALMLIDNIVARIKNNRNALGCYGFTTTTADSTVGFGTATPPVCDGFGTIETRATADGDIATWHSALLGEQESLGATPIGGATEGRGCITYVETGAGTFQLTVSIAWRGTGKGFTSTNTCGRGQYGADDSVRRVVSRTIVLGKFI